MHTKTIDLNGHPFFVRHWGNPENPPLLMLHGFRVWRRLGRGPTADGPFLLHCTGSARLWPKLGARSRGELQVRH